MLEAFYFSSFIIPYKYRHISLNQHKTSFYNSKGNLSLSELATVAWQKHSPRIKQNCKINLRSNFMWEDSFVTLLG